MIHTICNICGKDCDRSAYMITITPFRNFARYHTDVKPFGVCEKSASLTVCQNCYEKIGLPNPYECVNDIEMPASIQYTETGGDG